MAMSKLFSFSHMPHNVSLGSDIRQRRSSLVLRSRTRSTVVKSMSTNNTAAFPIMVNSCNGQMGKAVIKAADSAGLQILPVSIGSMEEAGNTIQVCGKKIQMLGTKDRESVLASLFDEHPKLIVVDFTVPAAVNDNADLYSKIGVPFVMGTTGGDRDRLYKTVEDSQVYAVISPQMGKPVVTFLMAMEYLAENCPGVFSGYSLQVMESHQTGKLDTSGTAKAVISCFQKMGVSFDIDQVQMIRDPTQQREMVGVPDEYLFGHAFHMYHLTSPDQTVSLEFQHNVCGRSVYAEGAVDAVIFLANKDQLTTAVLAMLLLFISGDGAAVPAATDDSAAASDPHATEHCDAVGVTEVVSTTGGAAFWAVGLRDPNIFTIVAGATLAAATTGATSLTGLTTARDFGEGATDALTVVLRVAAVASPATASSTCCHGYWIL